LCGSLSATSLPHYTSECVSLGEEVSFDTDIRNYSFTGENSRFGPWEDVHVDAIMTKEAILKLHPIILLQPEPGHMTCCAPVGCFRAYFQKSGSSLH